MKYDNKTPNTIKVIFLAFVLTVGIQYASAQSWSPPTQAPPAGNTSAPLNTGTIGQVKAGGLQLGTGLTNGSTDCDIGNGIRGYCTALGIVNGYLKIPFYGVTPTAGKVLTSDVNGVATWQTSTGGGGGGATGANPTASVGLAAVNGAATTFMRSDAAPALSQTITPTWSGRHIFANGLEVTGGGPYVSTFTGGRVGIGTVSPGATLHVTDYGSEPNGLIRVSRPFAGSGSTKNSTLQLYKSGTNWTGWALVNNDSGNFEINYDSSENTRARTPFFIKSSNGYVGIGTGGEYVGIGTTDPKMKLHVSDGSIYLDGVGKSIIMKSLGNVCYAITVSGTGEIGTLNAARVDCL